MNPCSIDYQDKKNFIKLAFFIAVVAKAGGSDKNDPNGFKNFMSKFVLSRNDDINAHHILTFFTLSYDGHNGVCPSENAIFDFINNPLSDELYKQLVLRKVEILSALDDIPNYYKFHHNLSKRAMKALWRLL